MAYPSNKATFGHSVEEYPTVIIKYPHSDHKAISYQERINKLNSFNDTPITIYGKNYFLLLGE